MRTVLHNVDWQNGDNLSKAATMSTTEGERRLYLSQMNEKDE